MFNFNKFLKEFNVQLKEFIDHIAGKKSDQKDLFIRIFLTTVFIISLIRLIGFIILFGQESIQMDFSAYYTAGEALNEGLSPYVNLYNHTPPIWDGVDPYKHSRFLYPPLVAAFFQPLAHLNYITAKYIWMFFSLFCIIVSVITSSKIINLKFNYNYSLIIGIFICVFFPLLIFLERGQIDAFVLLIIILAIKFMMEGKQVSSGILFAFAALFKLHAIYFLPFIILRKKWTVVSGFLIGGLLIIFLTLAFVGPALFNEYIHEDFPRIAKYGQGGTSDMRLDQNILSALHSGIKEGYAIKNDRIYKESSISDFVYSASIVRRLNQYFNKVENKRTYITQSIISISVLLGFLLIMAIWQMFNRDIIINFSHVQEFMYWQIIMIVVLLSGPLTWVMNTVWLIPIILIILSIFPLLHNIKQVLYLCLCTWGLIIVSLPDNINFLQLTPYSNGLFAQKYVISEIILFISLLFLMKEMKQENM